MGSDYFYCFVGSLTLSLLYRRIWRIKGGRMTAPSFVQCFPLQQGWCRYPCAWRHWDTAMKQFGCTGWPWAVTAGDWSQLWLYRLLCSSLGRAASLPGCLTANLSGKETSGGTDGKEIVLGLQYAGGGGKRLDRCFKKDHMNPNFLSAWDGLFRMLLITVSTETTGEAI